MSRWIDVPAREARAIRLRAGHAFRVIDVEGQQCGDLFAFYLHDVSEYVSAEHTRVRTSRVFPLVGQQFLTNRRRPMLTFLKDDSPGRHDMLVAACDPSRFEQLGVEGWHPSCQENMLTAMSELGYEGVDVPQPVNLFTNIPRGEHGELDWQPALTKPGDSVTLETELPCFVVLCACSQDILPINAKEPTGLAIEILGGSNAG
jgi:uncharacterized protein